MATSNHNNPKTRKAETAENTIARTRRTARSFSLPREIQFHRKLSHRKMSDSLILRRWRATKRTVARDSDLLTALLVYYSYFSGRASPDLRRTELLPIAGRRARERRERDKGASFDVKERRVACCNSRH